MVEKKRPTIAIIAGNLSSEYSTELVAGLRSCAKEEDVNLVFLLGPHIPAHCQELLYSSFSWNYEYQFHLVYDYVQFIKPDAIIIEYGSLSHFDIIPDVEEFASRFKDFPLLIYGDEVSDPAIPCLVGGNYEGMKETICHLIEEHGYTKIGFMAGPRRNFDSNARLKAYRDALEEHGIVYNDGMVVYGNYTEVVEDEVNYLLDNYPDLEAIAFANDTMAKGAYRVFAARDLVVGKDIAVTGFDDSDVCKTLEPSLTSVAHSSFMASYESVQAALRLIKGKMPKSQELKAYFRKRCSCGCESVLTQERFVEGQEELREYLSYKAKIITEELFSAIPYEKDKRKYGEWLKNLLYDIQSHIFEYRLEECSSEKSMYVCLRKLCQHPFISRRILLEYLEKIMSELDGYLTDGMQAKRHAQILKELRNYIHTKEINSLYRENMNTERKMWFQPSFITDLINSKMDLNEQMAYVMGRLKAMDIKSSYLFFHDEAILQKQGENLKTGEKMSFIAYHNETEIKAFSKSEIPRVSKSGEGIMPLLPQEQARFYTAYPLFSGNEQYGMMLCEIEHKDYPFMLSCSIQLGALRRIININISERKMKRELEKKNRILSEISMFDELSKLLNRRGFLENALHLLQNEKGKKACILFADVDHLKEINDSFGHGAGDFAIVTAADYLRQTMPDGAITARLGGDEYVSLFALDEGTDSQMVVHNFKEHMNCFNRECDQPFMVEMSAGVYEFICEENTDIGEMLKKSDELLYEDKKKRRTTVKKGL